MCGLLALADAEPERLQRLMARFVLASSSVNRKEILERAGIEFTVIVSNADESNGPKAPDALVKELSRRKLEAVLPKCESGDLVIAADTVVYIDGEILGKPKDLADANRFMHLLSGHVHTVFTGVCMAYHGERVSFSQESRWVRPAATAFRARRRCS